ncbi:hypothetical protein LINPERPRIM_LOCUS9177 [Linum perenne]
MDRWTPEAGRTSFLKKQGVAWISACGVPLHLRSEDLFRSIGNACGGYLEHDESGRRLSSVRIKVKLSSDNIIPDVVTVRYRDSDSLIIINREVSMVEAEWKAKKGKSVMVSESPSVP